MGKSKLTGSQQQAELSSLAQNSAAYLLGISPRTLRDRPGAPRNRDGSYPGPELVLWDKSTVAPTVLSGDDLERLLTLVEQTALAHCGDGLLSRLVELRDDHGSRGLVAFGESMITALGDLGAPEDLDVMTHADERHIADDAIAAARSRIAFDNFEISTQCEKCGRTRCGDDWKKESQPPHYETVLSLCPKCDV